MARLYIKRGTRAQLNAARTAGQLAQSEFYHVTDENRLALGKTINDYFDVNPPPDGTTGKVQFNNNGAFGGATNVEIASGNLRVLAAATPANTSAVNLIDVFGTDLAGKILPAIIGNLGSSTVLQAALHGKNVFYVSPSNAANVPTCFGGALSTAGTISHQQVFGSANRWQATRRTRFQAASTAGTAVGVRTGYTQWYLGNTANNGGFFFRSQFGININLAGGQKFCGLTSTAGLLGGEPSAMINILGCGYDSTDPVTGNWFFMRNDNAGVATKVDLGTGAARNTNDGYELIMFAAPNSQVVGVFIQNISTGAILLNTTYNTDVPPSNAGLAFSLAARNGAVAAADNIEISRCYIETDY